VLLLLSQQGGTCPLSEIRVTTISDTAGTGPVTLTKQQATKAWVNFSGVGTPAARDSFNLSSITDNSTGNYDVNYTSNMSATDYSVTTAIGQTSPFPIAQAYLISISAGFVRLNTAQPGTADYDTGVIASATFGDLA